MRPSQLRPGKARCSIARAPGEHQDAEIGAIHPSIVVQVGSRVASADRRKHQPEVVDIDAVVETGNVGLAGGFAFLPWTPEIATPLRPETSRDFIQTFTVTDAR